MAEVGKKLWSGVGNRLFFWCPGCDEAHVLTHGPDGWGWNGNGDAPAFTPSVLVTGTRMTAEGRAMLDRGENPPGGKYPSRPLRCHSFIGCNGAQPGQITFLADCTHALGGKTVDLPDWPDADSEEG